MDKLYLNLWCFLIYGFLGWCGEVIFAAVTQGRFVNRGFLIGPICPIYGFGVVIVCNALQPLAKDRIALLYIGAVVLTSALELVTGFLMEKLFHQRWWDYSNVRFNIGGYICLHASLAWGVACVLIVRFLHPLVLKLIDMLPVQIGMPILIVLIMFLVADTAVTVVSVNHLNRRLCQLDETAHFLKTVSDTLGENMADGAIVLKKKSEKVMALLHAHQEKQRDNLDAVQRRLLNAFPRMRSIHYPDTMEELKEHFIKHRKPSDD